MGQEAPWPLLAQRPSGITATPVTQELTVSPVYPFYSVNEVLKPASKRVYHNNSDCPPGRDIPTWERKQGTSDYRLCEDCARRNNR